MGIDFARWCIGLPTAKPPAPAPPRPPPAPLHSSVSISSPRPPAPPPPPSPSPPSPSTPPALSLLRSPPLSAGPEEAPDKPRARSCSRCFFSSCLCTDISSLLALYMMATPTATTILRLPQIRIEPAAPLLPIAFTFSISPKKSASRSSAKREMRCWQQEGKQDPDCALTVERGEAKRDVLQYLHAGLQHGPAVRVCQVGQDRNDGGDRHLPRVSLRHEHQAAAEDQLADQLEHLPLAVLFAVVVLQRRAVVVPGRAGRAGQKTRQFRTRFQMYNGNTQGTVLQPIVALTHRKPASM
jgi:hypothetical protein